MQRRGPQELIASAYLKNCSMPDAVIRSCKANLGDRHGLAPLKAALDKHPHHRYEFCTLDIGFRVASIQTYEIVRF